MNRTLALAGLILALVGILLLSIPFLVSSTFSVGIEVYLAAVIVLVGLVVMIRGATAADPSVTTVGGFLGNPVVDATRRVEAEATRLPPREARYLPGPREPVNCRQCYTAIPWNVAECPRCGRRRLCRSCLKPLFLLAGAVRCGPCILDEASCTCPRLSTPMNVRSNAARAR